MTHTHEHQDEGRPRNKSQAESGRDVSVPVRFWSLLLPVVEHLVFTGHDGFVPVLPLWRASGLRNHGFRNQDQSSALAVIVPRGQGSRLFFILGGSKRRYAVLLLISVPPIARWDASVVGSGVFFFFNVFLDVLQEDFAHACTRRNARAFTRVIMIWPLAHAARRALWAILHVPCAVLHVAHLTLVIPGPEFAVATESLCKD